MPTLTTDTNYSSGSYSNNEVFTIDQGAKFTIDQSTVDMRYVRCITFGEVLVKNTSTTQPIIVSVGSTGNQPSWRFEGAGVSKIEGEYISLGTGNGVAGQTFSIPLAQGVNGSGTQSCPDLGGLFIESEDELRNRTVVPKLALQVDDDGYTNAVDHEVGGNVFKQDTSANTVTFKRAIPSGKNVYMCNIILKSGSTLSSSKVNLDLAFSGEMNWNKCHIVGLIDLTMTNAKKVVLKNSVSRVPYTISINNNIQAPELESVIITSTDEDRVMSVNTQANAGTFKNIWYDSTTNGIESIVSCSATSNPNFEKNIVTHYGHGNGSVSTNTAKSCFLISNVTDPQIRDIFTFAPLMSIYCNNGTINGIIDNVKYMFSCRTDVTGQINTHHVRGQGAVSDTLFTNFEQLAGSNVYTKNASAITLGTSARNTLSGFVIRSGTSGNDRITNVISDAGNSNRFNDITVHGQISSKTVNITSSSFNSKVSNIYFVDQQSSAQKSFVGAKCRFDQVSTGASSFDTSATGSGVDSLSGIGIRNTANGGAIEKTDGLFQLRFSPTNEETQYFNAVTETGLIQFSNVNSLYIENSGDVVELESYFHNNISSIASSITLDGSTPSAFNVTVKMRRPNGSYTSYVAGTQSAMQSALASLASDSQNRVQFKFRIEKNVNGLSQNLNNLTFDVTLTGDDFPFEIGGLQVQGKGLISGSRVQLYNVTSNTEVTNDVLTDVNFAINYEEGGDYSQGDVVRLRATYQSGTNAYLPFEAFGVASKSGITFLIDQQQATTYNQYNVDGSSISEFSLDLSGGKIEIDITDPNNTTSIQRIGAWYFGQLMTSSGIENLFGAIDWIAGNQISIDQTKIDLKLDNKKSVPLLLTGGRLYRLDETTIISSTSNSIHLDYTPVYVTNMPLVSEIERNTKLIPALL